MAQLTLPTVAVPRPEDEGLTLRDIHWLPIVVPGCAGLLALIGLLVLSVA